MSAIFSRGADWTAGSIAAAGIALRNSTFAWWTFRASK
jgi:hypothetical protein